MILYFNPDCSKCNEAASLLKSYQCNFEIRNYLQNPPGPAEIKALLEILNCKPQDILRRKEIIFQEKFEGKEFSQEEWLKILSENPILIERPILIDGKRAVIGRPPQLVLEIVNANK